MGVTFLRCYQANISEGIFGTKVAKQGSQGKSETDAYTLCDSQHTVWVYTTDYLNDGSITPGEDNIIVSFSGIDSAGTGCAGDILMGGLKIFIDPLIGGLLLAQVWLTKIP